VIGPRTPRTSLSPELLNEVERALGAAGARPLALVGASASGKTRLLRTTLGARAVEPRWTTARDLVDALVEAVRSGHLDEHREAFTNDPRPLVVEHLEDVRGKTLTQRELQRLVDERIARGHAVFLTLTFHRGAQDVVDWLRACADVVQTT
jgi:chromosomal replication initiation ATPase DnaA